MTQNSTIDMGVKTDREQRPETGDFVGHLHALANPLASQGKLVVASFGEDPATGKALYPKIKHYQIGDAGGMAIGIAELSADRHRNVYIPMAVALRDLSNGKKAKEDQIVGVLGLVADFDDIDAANYAARLPVEPSLVLETSPGRFQAFVLFDHPIPVSQAKPLAQRLKAATRCDHGTADCSHVWRIPGTQNWPNKKKADAGRSLDPWTVRVAVPFEGLVISPAELDAAMPAAQVVELPRISLTQHRPAADDIEARMARSYPPGDRSEPAFGVICTLVEMGFSDDEIVSKAEAHHDGFGNRYIGREKLLAGDIERAHNKVTGRYSGHAGSATVSRMEPRARSDKHQQQSGAPEKSHQPPDPSDPSADSGRGRPDARARSQVVIPLGHDRGRYYYLSRDAQQVTDLTPAQHTKLELLGLAPLEYWEGMNIRTSKGEIDWGAIADRQMRACRKVGIYNEDRVRRRGAWLDEGRCVLHLGDRLIVDGVEHDLALPGSKYVYELAHPLSQSVAAPLPASEARKVIKIFQGFTWERPTIDGRLVAGWCAIAPISGMLAWRPTLWFAGASGAGKSTMTSCIALLLGGMAYYVQGVTTEAGIRQGLRNDARPVIFDEAEGDDTPAKLRMQSIIELVRQSSTEGGAEIVKGTAGQTGAKRYKVRSCFAFSSVNVTLEQAADQSRITVLSMIHPRVLSPEDAKKREEDWEKLKRDKDMTLTSDWCAAFVARSVKMAPMIRQNAVTYADAAAKLFGNRRMGDQVGALLAGAYSLESDDTLTQNQAESELVKYKKFFQTIEAEFVTDEQRLVHVILQMRVRASGGNMVYERTIGELLSSARPKGSIAEDDGEIIPARIADAELKRLGIRYEEAGSDKAEQRDSDDSKAERVNLGEGVWIANSNSNMQRLLANTPWSAQYRLTLQRLPGARKSSSMMKFGSSGTHRAVWVPMAAIFPN